MATMATGLRCCRTKCNIGGSRSHRLHTSRASSCYAGILSVKGFLTPSADVSVLLKRPTAASSRRVSQERLVAVNALNTGETPGEDSSGPIGLGTTRLKRIIQNSSRSVVSRFNRTRKHFPSKIFLLLMGYYSANALATVLGQTGDWDVLAAGILVAVIEGIGYLMYRMPSFLGERGQELVAFLNYYKSGFSFGLFVDAFKLGS